MLCHFKHKYSSEGSNIRVSTAVCQVLCFHFFRIYHILVRATLLNHIAHIYAFVFSLLFYLNKVIYVMHEVYRFVMFFFLLPDDRLLRTRTFQYSLKRLENYFNFSFVHLENGVCDLCVRVCASLCAESQLASQTKITHVSCSMMCNETVRYL